MESIDNDCDGGGKDDDNDNVDDDNDVPLRQIFVFVTSRANVEFLLFTPHTSPKISNRTCNIFIPVKQKLTGPGLHKSHSGLDVAR